MSRWFRLYTDILDDPKVQRLPPALFKTWVNLLCLTSRNDGELPSVPDIAFALRMDEGPLIDALNDLMGRGLIDGDDVLKPHNWDRRQFKSDTDPTATDRQRAKRERDRAQSPEPVTDVSRVTSHPPETDTEADTEIVIPTSREDRLAFEAYNDLAHEIAIPVAQNLTDERKTKIKARLNECGGLAGWLDALGKIRGSPFLRGDNDRQWKANLDFILQKSTFTRLMEGSYDGQSRTQPPRKNGSIADSFAILDAVADEAIRRAGGLEPQDGEADIGELSGLRKSAA